MNVKKILASTLALCIVSGGLPSVASTLNNAVIKISAADEYTEGKYESLYYNNYGDFIEITGCYDDTATEIVIPDEIEGVPVTSICDYAFEECESLKEITIPDSVTNIGDYAFLYCSSLTKINIPDGVTSIGYEVFCWCSSLTEIIIPDGVTSIGESAFAGCESLTAVTIPDGVTSIGSGAFDGCESLTEIIIPDDVASIGSGAFSYCSNLKKINIPDSVTIIDDYTFQECSSLTEIIIPDSVTSIGDYAFLHCSSLIEIIIPESAASIGNNAFEDCESLTEITILNPECEIADNTRTISSISNPYSSFLNGKICGYENSTAQQYAEKYKRFFTPLDKEYPLSGKKCDIIIPDVTPDDKPSLSLENYLRFTVKFQTSDSFRVSYLEATVKSSAYPLKKIDGFTCDQMAYNKTTGKLIMHYPANWEPDQNNIILFFGELDIPWDNIQEESTDITLEDVTLIDNYGRIIEVENITNGNISVVFNTTAPSDTTTTASSTTTTQTVSTETTPIPSNPSTNVTVYGDANQDGKADILDVIQVNKALLGKGTLSAQGLTNIDFNKNNVPDANESLAILKLIVGLFSEANLANF